jgi:hypothetical protein
MSGQSLFFVGSVAIGSSDWIDSDQPGAMALITGLAEKVQGWAS